MPSARVLGLLRRASRASGTGLLALADPPLLNDGLGPNADARLRGASITDGLALSPLPLARREAALAAHEDQDRVWLGVEASEASLREVELEGFAVVHFATHAVVDELHPGRSAIVLASEGGDGLLQPREIVGLELDGKLVVLSACSSARGLVVDGEGVMGLAHALFGAGTRTVVASLWPVRDDDALALFERFYAHLDAGLDVATALRNAQVERASAGAPPAAWAGVVALGDGTMIPFPEGREPASNPDAAAPAMNGGDGLSRALIGGLALLVMAIGGAVFLRHR